MIWLLSAAFAGPCETLVEELDQALETPGRCGTRAMFGLQREASSLGVQACFEQHLRQRNLPVAGPKPPPIAWGNDGDLGNRDIYGYSRSYETEHFVIWWEDYEGFNDNDVEALGVGFENVWAWEVEQMGYTPPSSTTNYRFNVYIGDTGGPLSAGGNGGWYNTDDDGYPMIVMNNDIGDHENSAHTAGHEFFHALQDEAGTYQYYGQGAWYWEATAMWAESEVSPESSAYSVFYPGWAMLPALPVNFFRYADGTLEGYHQYGASILPRHLTENVTDRDIIRRSWEEAPYEGDPMEVLNELLAEEAGTSIESEYTEMAGRTATFDFIHGDAMYEVLDWWEESDFHSKRISGSLELGDDEVRPDADQELHTYGAGFWELDDFADGTFVRIEGDNGPNWHAVIAAREGSTHTRIPLEFDGNQGSLEITGIEEADEAWLVVTAIDAFEDGGQTWSYSVSVGDDSDNGGGDDTADTDEEPPLACGCVTPGIAGSWIGLPLVGLLVRRRQRSQRAASAA